MADIYIFLQQGWKNIWKQNDIFLFSALSVLIGFINFFSTGLRTGPILLFLIPLVILILFLASAIGVPFMAYRSLIGEPASYRETLAAIRKFSLRWIGCSGLGFLMLAPFLIISILLAGIISLTPVQWSPSYGEIIGLLLMPFGSILDFCLFGFFTSNHGIVQTLKQAWSLFTGHYWTLGLLSVILSILLRGSSLLSAVLTVLLQNGIEGTSLGGINLLNPGLLLNKNIIFLSINAVGQITLGPFISLVYGSAYLKYTNVKKLS